MTLLMLLILASVLGFVTLPTWAWFVIVGGFLCLFWAYA
jgi:hypothetical protein